MKKLFFIIISFLMILCCSTIKEIPVKEIINYKDSTIVNVIDSVRYIPKERIVDITVEYDTLKLETSKAISQSWIDTTTHTLKGILENKEGIEYKYIYKDRIEYKDSLQIKEIPVKVEVEKKYVPRFYKTTAIICFLTYLVIGICILLKIYFVRKI